MILFLVLYFVNVISACIPTQETEPITLPCSACAPIYDTSCMGYNMPTPIDWCAMVTVPYALTAGTPDTCTSTLPCPAGTKPQFFVFVGCCGADYADGDNGAITCDETGASMGVWRASVGGAPTDFTNMRCQVI